MAKRKSGGGRVTAKGTRPAGWQPKQHVDASGQRPPFADEARALLRERSPLPLMAFAAQLLTALRSEREPGEPPLDPQAVLGGMALSGAPELAALALTVAELLPAEAGAAALAATARPAAHSVRTAWLAEMGDITITGTTMVVDPYGDQEQLTVSWQWPNGEPGTLCALVDHNLGHVLGDCYVIPVDGEQVRADLAEAPDGVDLDVVELDAAATRARITTAIERADVVDPAVVTDDWPLVRPLVEWVLARLPADGPTFVDAQWSDDDCHRLVDEFLASPHRGDIAEDRARVVVEQLVAYARTHANGDASRLSPIAIEILLTHWLPEHLATDPFDAIEPVLIGWARFVAERRGFADHLLDEMLAAIETFTS